jgi:hypothetical protein
MEISTQYTMRCSCGAETTIRLTGTGDAQKFIPDNEDWQFRDGRTAKTREDLGWYCGQDGHRQARFTPIGDNLRIQ